MFSRLPRFPLKICLLSGACLGVALVVLSVFIAPTRPAPAQAATSAQHNDQGICQTTIEGHVPSPPLSVVSQDGCNDFSMTVFGQIAPTKVFVCPQSRKPPLLLQEGDTYDRKHCISWIAQDSTPHSIKVSRQHPPAGYIILFANTENVEEYQIKAVIQQ